MEANPTEQNAAHASSLAMQQLFTGSSSLPIFLKEYAELKARYAELKARLDAALDILTTTNVEDPKYKTALGLAEFLRKLLDDTHQQIRLVTSASAVASTPAPSTVPSVPSVASRLSSASSGSHHLTALAQPSAKRHHILNEVIRSLSGTLLENAAEIPEGNRRAVQDLFGRGLTLAKLSEVANPPIHHHFSTRDPVPDVVHCPGPQTKNETQVVYFVCYLVSALVGLGFRIHDIHTRRNGKSGSPDIMVTPAEQEGPPLIAETGNFALEIKTDENFGTSDHVMQAVRYASSIHTNFGFNQCFVVLASQAKVQFLMMEFSGQEHILYQSKCMNLSMHQGVLSEGLRSLRAFVLNARSKMIAAEKPELVVVTDLNTRISLEWNDCEFLAYKSSSMTRKVVRGSSSCVLKHVAYRHVFEDELVAMKRIAPHNNVASCTAYDIRRGYLLIEPAGDCSLDAYPIAKHTYATRFVEMMGPLLEGLEHVHKQGWLHRDIRPENIVFCEQSKKLVLIDFGLAKAGPLYESTAFVGYPKFSPDEHLHQLVNVDKSQWTFTWSVETDRKALFRVAKFVTNILARDYLTTSYDKYSTCEKEEEKMPLLREFLALRQRLFAESDLISLEAAFRLT